MILLNPQYVIPEMIKTYLSIEIYDTPKGLYNEWKA